MVYLKVSLTTYSKWKPLLKVLMIATMTLGPTSGQTLSANPKEVPEKVQTYNPKPQNTQKAYDATKSAVTPTAWALRDALGEFFTKLKQTNHNQDKLWTFDKIGAKHMHDEEGILRLMDNDKIMSQKFMEMFKTAFLKDSVAQSMHLREPELKKMKKSFNAIFAPSPVRGYFLPDYMFVATGPGGGKKHRPSVFVQTAIHEVGHFFGLNESLASLFAEELNGTGILVDWQYGSIFDRLLLAKAGPQKFWKAAFTSGEAYRALWKQYIPYLNYDDLKVTKTVGFFLTVPCWRLNQRHIERLRNALSDRLNPLFMDADDFKKVNSLSITEEEKTSIIRNGSGGVNKRKMFSQQLLAIHEALRKGCVKGIAQFQEFARFIHQHAKDIPVIMNNVLTSTLDTTKFRQFVASANANVKDASDTKEYINKLMNCLLENKKQEKGLSAHDQK